jgi:hypothetical protein
MHVHLSDDVASVIMIVRLKAAPLSGFPDCQVGGASRGPTPPPLRLTWLGLMISVGLIISVGLMIKRTPQENLVATHLPETDNPEDRNYGA